MPGRQGKHLLLSRSIDNGVDFRDQSVMGPPDGLILRYAGEHAQSSCPSAAR
ncbi:MAG: hypothetical protein GX413_11985 [Acetobacter sp.]|nr:hypothetical protein [Acetobacter sp.]